MASVLVSVGYVLIILGFFIPMFNDDLKKRTDLWLAVIGLGLASMILSIVIFSAAFVPQGKTEEPDNSSSNLASNMISDIYSLYENLHI